MNVSEFKRAVPSSPAYLLDIDQVVANLKPLQALREASGCKVLYSIKALPLVSLLESVKGLVDGFSVSSLFEARLANEVLGDGDQGLHLTSPGIRPQEFSELGRLCSHISFNSLSQCRRLSAVERSGYSRGLRINPKLSFADDKRYDPCRTHSKLGVDVESLPGEFCEDIEGLHFHTVFAREDFLPLLSIVANLKPLLKRHPRLKWLNFGGGYLYNSLTDRSAVIALIKELRDGFGLEVFLEPGRAVVASAGYLICTVLDRFESDGKTVLILDTSVNHHPEVFEYQIKPELSEEDEAGMHGVILAGSTCMAGDLFGEYRFDGIPEMGERLTFCNVGAYTLIKANRFNGYNLPDIYRIEGGQFSLLKHYTYEDYRGQWVHEGENTAAQRAVFL